MCNWRLLRSCFRTMHAFSHSVLQVNSWQDPRSRGPMTLGSDLPVRGKECTCHTIITPFLSCPSSTQCMQYVCTEVSRICPSLIVIDVPRDPVALQVPDPSESFRADSHNTHRNFHRCQLTMDLRSWMHYEKHMHSASTYLELPNFRHVE